MKIVLYTLMSAILCSTSSYAQNSHVLTIGELKELAQCPDQNCFLAIINPWNFKYKGTRKGKLNRQEGTQHRYVRSHPNPLFAEATASYWVMNDDNRRVVLASDNKDWITGLENAIRQGGFTSVGTKGTFSTDEEQFSLTENGVIWHLTWSKPSFMTETAPHTITIYRDSVPPGSRQAAGTPSVAGATSPSPDNTSEPPHPGGDWDKNYPVRNAADIFRAERAYATEYDRKNGRVGHTFFRVEKMRIQGKRTGQYRSLTPERWDTSFDLALNRTGFGTSASERATLFKREALFDIAGERVWVPIQEPVTESLEKEAKVGQMITLYALLVSYHDFGGTLHLSFLVNEFAAPKAAKPTEPFANQTATGSSVTAKSPPATTGQQPTAEESPYAHLLKETPSTTNTTGSSKSGSTGCGFNWKPWSSVSVAEKNEMRKVMVSQYEEPNVSLIEFISNELSQSSKIQLARYDFHQDGQAGYVVYIEYKLPQDGNKGRVEVFENLGDSKIWPAVNVKNNLCAVRPFDNNNRQSRRKGVMDEDGKLDEFLGNTFFEQEYALFLKKTKQNVPVKLSTNLRSVAFSGGKTPEELCQVLIKALKTNDKALWMRCMDPDDSAETDELSARRFDLYRECLDENGITDWPLVTYSRMTHLARPNGGDKVDLSKIRSRVSIEFTYKNQEFVGRLDFGAFTKVNDRWLVWSGDSMGPCKVFRSMR